MIDSQNPGKATDSGHSHNPMPKRSFTKQTSSLSDSTVDQTDWPLDLGTWRYRPLAMGVLDSGQRDLIKYAIPKDNLH